MWSSSLSLFLQSIEELLESIDSILKIMLDAHGWLLLPVFPSYAAWRLKVRDKGEWSTAVSLRVK